MERARARPSVVVYGRGEVKRGRASVESIRRWVEGLSTLQCRNFPEKEDFARAEAPGVHNRQTMEMRWTRTTRGSTDRLRLNRWPTFYRLFRSPVVRGNSSRGRRFKTAREPLAFAVERIRALIKSLISRLPARTASRYDFCLSLPRMMSGLNFACLSKQDSAYYLSSAERFMRIAGSLNSKSIE